MPWRRALLIGLLIVVAESVHGVLRQIFVVPVVGDLAARQWGVLSGSLIIFAIAWLTARWLDARTRKLQLQVGALWVALILLLEFSLVAALGYGRERLLADYNPAQGGLMLFGLAFLLLTPIFSAHLRGITRHAQSDDAVPPVNSRSQRNG